MYGYFIEKETLTRTPKATFTSRSLLQLGSPPAGFIDANDKVAEQRDHFFAFFKVIQTYLFERFNAVSTPFKSPYRQLNTDDGDLNVKWMSVLLFNKDAGETANYDFSMVVFSVLFVYVWISVHTGSFFLGTVGILQIMLSIPVSFFFLLLRISNYVFCTDSYFGGVYHLGRRCRRRLRSCGRVEAEQN